jgi:hypothetical protein
MLEFMIDTKHTRTNNAWKMIGVQVQAGDAQEGTSTSSILMLSAEAWGSLIIYDDIVWVLENEEEDDNTFSEDAW